MKNDYVKLEPRPKEVFEISDVFTTDSGVQVIINGTIKLILQFKYVFN